MLSVHNINKSFGIVPVLKNISFNLNDGEKIGLVGPNGCGKTTLLRILAGQERTDSGTFSLTSAGARLGYLSQSLEASTGETVGHFLLSMQGDLPALSQRLMDLAAKLAADPGRSDLQNEYDSVLASIESAADAAGTLESTLAAFELDNLPKDQLIASLSGGQKTRLGLAGLLLSNPQVLLLDEPTNHLDFDMLEWLEDWILHSRSAVLLVSHDRVFLDRTMQSILELDPETHQARLYPGTYSQYLEAKSSEKAQQWQAYSDQQVEIRRLKLAARHYRDLATFKKGGKADTADKFAKGFFANRGLATVRRAKSIEKKIETLMTDEKVGKPHAGWQMKMELENVPTSSRQVLTLKDLSVGYGEKVILSGINETVRYGERILLIGSNGCGKSTLLRTINGQLPPLAGTFRLGTSVKVGYMAQDQTENLDPARTVVESLQRVCALNETDARSLLHKYLFSGDEALLPVAQCSFGMRSRLVLACLVAQGCNFLILDEPLNHLDIPSRSQFENALAEFEGTILSVSHDRYFIQRFASRVWEVQGNSLVSYLPYWEEPAQPMEEIFPISE
jgi:ATP-binding cassette subfamily F protein 3